MKKLALLLILATFTTSCTQIKHLFVNLSVFKNPNTTIKRHSVKPVPIPAQYNDIIYPRYKNGLLIECENNIQDIKQVLGKPYTVKIKHVPNQHIGSQIDEIHELFYDGLNIFVYVVKEIRSIENMSFIINITLTGKKYTLPERIRIGSPLNLVKSNIKHLMPSKGFFVYHNLFEDGYQEEVRFYFLNDKLSKVVWICPVD